MSEKSNEDSANVFHRNSPREVTFNEKTGKASQPSHVQTSGNSSENASAATSGTLGLKRGTQTTEQKIHATENNESYKSLVAPDADTKPTDTVGHNLDKENSSRKDSTVIRARDQTAPEALLFIDEATVQDSQPLHGVGGPINGSENLSAIGVETEGHVVRPANEEPRAAQQTTFVSTTDILASNLNHASVKSPVADSTLKTGESPIDGAGEHQAILVGIKGNVVSAPIKHDPITPIAGVSPLAGLADTTRTNVDTKAAGFASNTPPVFSEGSIAIPLTNEQATENHIATHDSTPDVNIQTADENKSPSTKEYPGAPDTSTFQPAPSNQAAREGKADNDHSASVSGSMRISLNANTLEKLAKEAQMSKELDEKLHALSLRVQKNKK